MSMRTGYMVVKCERNKYMGLPLSDVFTDQKEAVKLCREHNVWNRQGMNGKHKYYFKTRKCTITIS